MVRANRITTSHVQHSLHNKPIPVNAIEDVEGKATKRNDAAVLARDWMALRKAGSLTDRFFNSRLEHIAQSCGPCFVPGGAVFQVSCGSRQEERCQRHAANRARTLAWTSSQVSTSSGFAR